MKLPQTGGCQCGKVRYEVTEQPLNVYTCHCLDCQRLTSSAFSLGVVVPETGFRLTGIEPRRLQRMADSGRTNVRLVCPECGSWVCSVPREGARPPAGRHARRHVLAASDPAHLDPQQAGLGRDPRGRRGLRGPAALTQASGPEEKPDAAPDPTLSEARGGVRPRSPARHGIARMTAAKPPLRLGFFTRLLDQADAAERYRLALAQIVACRALRLRLRLGRAAPFSRGRRRPAGALRVPVPGRFAHHADPPRDRDRHACRWSCRSGWRRMPRCST